MRTLRRGAEVVWALLVLWAGSAAASPEGIAHPPHDYYVRDTTGQLSSATLNTLNTLARGVDLTGVGQIGIAVVPTTEGLVPRTYATRLFNAWGIGHRGADDGILLFVALSDHKAEIVLGTGLERTGRVTSADTDAVMRDQVVRNFKAGQPERALIDGTRALAALLERQASTAAPSVPAPAPAPAATVSPEATARVMGLLSGQSVPDRSPRSWTIDLADQPPPAAVRQALEKVGNGAYADGKLSFFFLWFDSDHPSAPALCSSLHDALAPHHPRLALLCRDRLTGSLAVQVDGVDSRAPKMREAASRVTAAFDAMDPDRLADAAQLLVGYGEHGLPLRSAQEVFDDVYHHNPLSFFFGGGSFFVFGLFGLLRWNRFRSRTCQHCGRARQLLSATAELSHLSQAQRREQEVGSVDYDVWWCGVCHDVWVNHNTSWFSRYSRCPQCNSRTRQSSTSTLEYATEWSTGLVEVKEWCANCNYQNRYTRVTSRLSSSSDSSWGSSSSSSSSSSSFGGGSSSGGGSSGSW